MSEVIVIFLATRLHILIVIMGIIFLLVTSMNQKKKLIQIAIVVLPVSFVLSKIASILYYNPRPFVVGSFDPLIFHIADNGFPSDHMLLVSVIAIIVLMFDRFLGAILILLSILVGMGRVLSDVHHLFDIVGSVVIVLVAVCFVSHSAYPMNSLIDRDTP